MKKISLNMKFWDDGEENSTRIRNVKFCWRELQELSDYLSENGFYCVAELFDFSHEKIIEDSTHIPYPIGEYKKAEKTNLILTMKSNYDFFMMVDCDAFFDKQDYPLILNLFRNLSTNDIITFDLAKLTENISDYLIDGKFRKENADWSYAYSGDKNLGPLKHHMGGLGGVYLIDTKLLTTLGGFDENYVNWGAEDGEMLGRIMYSGLEHRIVPTKNFSPFHLPHFVDMSNPYYNTSNLTLKKNKVKFITAIYSNLNGTEYGGRPSRGGHYRWSLISLLRMTDADFLCYTSENELEELENFFYEQHKIDKNRLKFKIFDLKFTKHKSLIDDVKDKDSVIKGDRCYEIQYNKFFWFQNEDWSYDYYYWIDAGLCHCGIIPDKYISFNNSHQGYYNSYFFDNNFLKKLISKSQDKISIICKDNTGDRFWMHGLPPQYYKLYDVSYHVIGGIFGGDSKKMSKYVEEFEKTFVSVTEKEKFLFSEEQIMTLLYFNNKENFNTFYFDIWWHENNVTNYAPENYIKENKSFYKSLEDIKN